VMLLEAALLTLLPESREDYLFSVVFKVWFTRVNVEMQTVAFLRVTK
jgi:hypothetical protein